MGLPDLKSCKILRIEILIEFKEYKNDTTNTVDK